MMGGWLMGAESRRLSIERGAWLILPGVLSLVLFAYGRRTEIPVAQRPSSVRMELDPAWRMANVSEESSRDWRDLSARLLAPSPAQIADRESLSAEILAFAELRRTDTQLVDPALTLSLTPAFEGLHRFVSEEGRRLEATGDFSGALDLYLAASRTALSLCESWPECRQDVLALREAIFGRLVEWANSPDLTAEDLRDAVPRLHSYRVSNWGITSAAREYAAIVDQLVEQHGPFYDAFVRLGGEVELSESSGQMRVWEWLARACGEYERVQRLAHQIAAHAKLLAAPGDRIESMPDELGRFESVFSLVPLGEWLQTTPGMLPSLARPTQPHRFLRLYGQLAQMSAREAAASRAVLLVAALQLYRREHGQFPEDPWDLRGLLANELPQTPYLDGELTFHARGLPGPCVLNQGRVIAAGQPVLIVRLDDWGLFRMPADQLPDGMGTEGVFYTSRRMVAGNLANRAGTLWSDPAALQAAIAQAKPDPQRVVVVVVDQIAWTAGAAAPESPASR
jgi:hypothetical protein